MSDTQSIAFDAGVRAKRMIDDLKWFHEQGVRVLIFARKRTLTVKFTTAPAGRKPKKGGV